MIALLCLLQAAAPTVGDTIWVARSLRPPRGAEVRAPAWTPSGAVELVGPPVVVARGDSVELRFPLVAWLPGPHTIELPGPVLLLRDGRVDSLPPQPVTLTVASVLPNLPGDSTPAPQPPAETVRRSLRSVVPLAVLLTVALALLVPFHLWWGRRGPAPPRPPAAAPAGIPTEDWIRAGEGRAVVNAAAARLRAAIAQAVPDAHRALDTEACLHAVRAGRPDWPLGELAALLRALDTSRFESSDPASARALHERAAAMVETLGAAGAAA